MKKITLTTEGSARVETGPFETDSPDTGSPQDTMSTSKMVTRYRLWIVEEGSEEQLAYVRRTMRTKGGHATALYMLSDRHGTKELEPEAWHAMKAGARQTDAMAEAGPEGVQLINAALQGRLSYSDAVRQIENRRLQTSHE